MTGGHPAGEYAGMGHCMQSEVLRHGMRLLQWHHGRMVPKRASYTISAVGASKILQNSIGRRSIGRGGWPSADSAGNSPEMCQPSLDILEANVSCNDCHSCSVCVSHFSATNSVAQIVKCALAAETSTSIVLTENCCMLRKVKPSIALI